MLQIFGFPSLGRKRMPSLPSLKCWVTVYLHLFLSAQWMGFIWKWRSNHCTPLFLTFLPWLMPWPSFLVLSHRRSFSSRTVGAALYTLPRGRTCRRFFWRPWCVALSNARMLKLSVSSLSPIRDSFRRESNLLRMCDSTWWWPLPCRKTRVKRDRRFSRSVWGQARSRFWNTVTSEQRHFWRCICRYAYITVVVDPFFKICYLLFNHEKPSD